MTILQSILLGVVQGLTEFLPISSSGHLVIVPHLLGWHIPNADAFVFDVLVQMGTLLAVIIYFWKDLIGIIGAFFTGLVRGQPFADPQARQGWLIILATIPAGAIGLVLKSAVEDAFSSVLATGVFLLITAAMLAIGERVGKRIRIIDQISWKEALWMGCFQALAIFPGVSRSGSTITGAMTRDLERPAAARFSFLMAIPIMVAAGLLASVDMVKIPNYTSLIPVFIPGFLTAAIVGYLSIRWLLGYLTRHPLYVFSIYCTAVGLLAIIIGLLGR
ncbi:MAG: undecaprenyl-diphosphatase UppP [Anaerolineales bacterium]